MVNPLLTLTTDFGSASPYVAAVKGVILSLNPDARLVDLSHDLPPQDLRHCSFFLRAALPFFPPGTLHVIVVDPGVGTERAILYVETRGQRLLVPDNGCWTAFAGLSPQVRRVTEPAYRRPEVSTTFHGRDIFAPAAGHLSRGLNPALLGPEVTQWVDLVVPAPQPIPGGWKGEVAFVDDFGNLITNVSGDAVAAGARVEVGGQLVDRRVRTYGEAAPETLVTLCSSVGTLEIAVVQGSAAHRLGVVAGAPVRVLTREAPSR
jgi:S-adenosylmethionine hydrolase